MLTLLLSLPIKGKIWHAESNRWIIPVFHFILLRLIGDLVQLWNNWHGARPGREAVPFSSEAFSGLLTVRQALLTLDAEMRALYWEFSSLAGVQNLFLVSGQNSMKEITLSSSSLPEGIISQMPCRQNENNRVGRSFSKTFSYVLALSQLTLQKKFFPTKEYTVSPSFPHQQFYNSAFKINLKLMNFSPLLPLSAFDH